MLKLALKLELEKISFNSMQSIFYFARS